MPTCPLAASRSSRHWNRWLLRKIGWSFLAKLAALALLSWLFFGADKRASVDGDVMHGVFFSETEQAHRQP